MTRYLVILWFLLQFHAVWGHRENDEEETWMQDPPRTDCTTADYSPVTACTRVIGQAHACEGRGHLAQGERIPWQSDPPHSGVHYLTWETRSGEHEQPIPRGNWVHNLEHGHILLLYNCPQGCDTELEVYREALLERLERTILITPDPLLRGPRFAAVAWTWVYRADSPDLNTLLCFIDQHAGHGPEDLPLH